MSQYPVLHQWLAKSVRSMKMTHSSSVEKWLEELRPMTECECMSILQGKSIKHNAEKASSSSASSYLSYTAEDSIHAVQSRAEIIHSEFKKLYSRIDKERWKQVGPGSLRIATHIRSLLHECNSNIPNPPAVFTEQQQYVMEECARLVQYVETNSDILNNNDVHRAMLREGLTTLSQAFSVLVDMAMGCLIQILLNNVLDFEEPEGVKEALGNLIALGLEGEQMCHIITREGGVETLLELCKNEELGSLRGKSLRALATLCCTSDSIQELENNGGIEILAEVLCSSDITESVRSEAAGVVAQMTSPNTENYEHGIGFLENMEDLVKSLTVLCIEASSHEVFLLGSAALANITFTDTLACDFLLQYSTAQHLIHAVQLNKADSLFAKDQVATILANMASSESCWLEITENNGVETLLQFLQEQPYCYQNEAEISACERVQQKAAIALTRLSRDRDCAEIIVELQGIHRLVQICREPKERNSSDGILVACLAALRKIYSVSCDIEDLSDLDVEELIQPKLLDSFLLCSQSDECFV